MLRSMTGFGRAEATQHGLHVTAEILSLNNRFLEITCRLPRQLTSYEWHIREFVRQHLSRGTVTVPSPLSTWTTAPLTGAPRVGNHWDNSRH
ncbi:MAG: YicC/YloC family endoribonuclease, partial [Bacteroidota bacterium]|nr:YicC/YloC family endoribonuclease [Bacteroidota bacterium]